MHLKSQNDENTCKWIEKQSLTFSKIYNTATENDNSIMLVEAFCELTKDSILTQDEFVVEFVNRYGLLGNSLEGTEARLRRIYPSFVREEIFYQDCLEMYNLVLRSRHLDQKVGVDFLLFNEHKYALVKLTSNSSRSKSFLYIKNKYRHKSLDGLNVITLTPDITLGKFYLHSIKQIEGIWTKE